jgi:hypothetical protein
MWKTKVERDGKLDYNAEKQVGRKEKNIKDVDLCKYRLKDQ